MSKKDKPKTKDIQIQAILDQVDLLTPSQFVELMQILKARENVDTDQEYIDDLEVVDPAVAYIYKKLSPKSRAKYKPEADKRMDKKMQG